MDYICYYDIIAAVLLSMLFALYFMRRNYPTSTNKAYLAMLICISLSTITDLLSMYTIPRADIVPLWLPSIIPDGLSSNLYQFRIEEIPFP